MKDFQKVPLDCNKSPASTKLECNLQNPKSTLIDHMDGSITSDELKICERGIGLSWDSWEMKIVLLMD